jgi:hypothetical protein
MYGKHLQSKDWFVRALGVVALSRIDAPETTVKLLEVLAADDDGMVRVLAWEALHARNATLSDSERLQWVRLGIQAGLKGHFQGDFRASLIDAAVMCGTGGKTETEIVKLVLKYVDETDHNRSRDSRTLTALRNAVAAWTDPDLVGKLVERLQTNARNRAEYVLGGLPSGVKPIGRYAPPYRLFHRNRKTGTKTKTQKPSETEQDKWSRQHALWTNWLERADLAAADSKTLPKYVGFSRLLAPPERIDNPDDPNWRKDLEPEKLKLDRFDITFAIDSTGSMSGAIEWIKEDVTKMMFAFRRISREPRIGVVFYRDRPDAKTSYCVRINQMTGDAARLRQAIARETACGGGDSPEAVYEALFGALHKQTWRGGASTKKIVMLVGDAPPHKEVMGKIEDMVRTWRKKGFTFHAAKVGGGMAFGRVRGGGTGKPYLWEFDEIAKWGQGECIDVSFQRPGTQRDAQIAPPSETGTPFEAVVGEIIRSTVNEGYRDRIDPLIRVLLEWVDDRVE